MKAIAILCGGPQDGMVHAVIRAGKDLTIPIEPGHVPGLVVDPRLGETEHLYEFTGRDPEGRLLYVYRGVRAVPGSKPTRGEQRGEIERNVGP